MSGWLLTKLAATMSSVEVERMGWLLVHSLWQFSLLALVAFVLSQLLRRQAATMRYWVLISLMSLTAFTPLATWFLLAPKQLANVAAWREPLVALPSPTADQLEPLDGRDAMPVPRSNARAVDTLETPGPKKVSAANAAESYRTASESICARVAGALRPWLPTVVVVWILGVLAFAPRLMLSWYTIRRLCSIGIAAVDEPVQQAILKLKHTLFVRRSVQVFQSTLVDAPVVVGCFRSVILLPISLVSGLPPAQLEAILAHELAHVRRYDCLLNLLQTLVETFFFYHPAVWWISHRIRVERENCCDDLVVAALGDRVQYGRALLAIEENRGTASILALGARDGSLLSRIQRLSGITRVEKQPPFSSAAGLVFAGAALAAALMAITSGFAETGVTMEADFGTESHGLRCRLITISPDANDDSPDLKNVASGYLRSADLTFAVELKNVGSKRLTLAGVRYGDGYSEEMRGTLRTEMLAPHLFDFVFTDAAGKPVPRVAREYFNGWHVLSHASIHELMPGQSLIVVLRPGKFQTPMDYDLAAGQYSVKVRYRGPDDSLRKNVEKHWPDKPILAAWPHEVVSNPVAFSIAESSRRAQPEDLVRGKPLDGLQAALEYRLPDGVDGDPLTAPGVPLGTNIGVVFHLRNVRNKPISFISETGRQGDYCVVTDESGNKVDVKDVFFTGIPIDVAWTLAPGDTAQLHVLAPAINTLDRPGRYTVRYTVRFNSRVQRDEAGNVIFPRPGDYKSELDTGETPLFLFRDHSSADQARSEAPFRLPDHWIIKDVQYVDGDNEITTVAVQGGVSVRRWNVADRKLVSEIKLGSDQHGRSIRQDTLQLSADGRRVIGATDDYVGIWDAGTGDLLKTLEFPSKQWEYDCIRCLDCSSDLSVIVAGLGTSYEKTALVYNGYGIVWDVASGEVVRLMVHENGFYFRDIAMSYDGQRFATCNEHGGGVCIWDTSSGNLLRDFSREIADWESPDPELIKNNMINTVALSPDGSLLAISGTYGVKLVDSTSGELRRKIDAPYRFHSGRTRLIFSADGSKLARVGAGSTGSRYSVPIWSTSTGEKLFDLATKANAGAFSSDATAVAIGGSDFYEALSVWPLSGEVVKSFSRPPIAYPRIDRVEENTHHRGKKSEELIAKWKPVWGEPQHGIKYGVALTVSKTEFREGERVSLAAFFRNVGDKPQQFDVRPDMFGNLPRVVNATGQTIAIERRPMLGDIAHYRDTLAPGESFGPLYLSLGLGEEPRPHRQIWVPYWANPVIGKYQLTHSVSIQVAKADASDDEAANRWTAGKLTSGTIEFEVVDGN